ncbi:nuclear fragile X mental retardation-interacting protein 2 [Oryzias melastigma]|nr:nuclear fragile X mental retardation-interacting protein 2 [Oryzias melastigma]
MEEQPKDRAQERQNHHYGEDRNYIQHTLRLKNDQSQLQCQHQETQAKKTGNKKVIVSDGEGEKNAHLPDAVGMLHSSNSNGNRHLSNAHVKQKGTQRHHAAALKVSNKGSDYKKTMDLKNEKEKAVDLSHHEVQPSEKKDSVLLQNGVVNCGLITNGYSSKDNDGSGSEGGYTTPKKRRTRCNNVKNFADVTKDKEKDAQPSNSMQEPRALNLDPAEKGLSSRTDGFKSTHKAEMQSAVPGECPRKNSEGKAAATFSKKTEEKQKGKNSSPSKEDSWTLFKPLPAFPVDNSSAKIVPKISYASKVKENLKVAQGGEEAAPPPPVRMSQVPMSAMKTITSASFTNGPVSGNGNCCPTVGIFFAPAASSLQSAPSIPSGENVATSVDSNCSSTTSPVDGETYELQKCSLLIYPLNMQPVLPSARHLDPPAAQTNQKALRDIFQNQWGLSFINEPNLGLEGGNGLTAAEDQTPVTSQSEATKSCFDAAPSLVESCTLSQDSQKRTCAPCQASNPCSPACMVGEEETKLLPCSQDKTKTETKGAITSMSTSSKDNSAKSAQGQLTMLLFGSPKEQILSKDTSRRCSWGSFDLKAAVTYHTKEMEFIFHIQKQDPKRVVIYDETKDEPGQ